VLIQGKILRSPDSGTRLLSSVLISRSTPYLAGMLRIMQQLDPSAPLTSSFSGMLSAFIAPVQKRTGKWDDPLDEEGETLSYERALRTHARYKPSAPDDSFFTMPSASEPTDQAAKTAPSLEPRAEDSSTPEIHPSGASPEPERTLKCASITIRLSQAECVQLRARAAEAGLTVSAYMRSCTFEAESLRALVKDALTQLHANSSIEVPTESPPGQRGFPKWFGRMWPCKRQSRHIADA